MYVDIAVCLFFLPEAELDDYELNGAGLRRFAADLSQRLRDVGAVVDKLRGDGWTIKVVANNLEARHPQVKTYDEAVARLNRLQLEEGREITDIAEWSDAGERLTTA